MPFFSVILATRDRPGPFAEALDSVLAQDFRDVEVIVVDDGSAEAHRAGYEAALARAEATLGERFRLCRLPRRPRGHGPAFGRNRGAACATGRYLCFLDDDDLWTDPGHLGRAAAALAAGADLYLGNQRAWRGGAPDGAAHWLEGLAASLSARGLAPGEGGAFAVPVEALMALETFAHLNILIVRRALFEAAGGLDEALRWEEDRDLFLRLIDRAQGILHHPAEVARHNVPDPAQGASMTTSLAMLDRWLYQLRVLDKAALFARHPAIRAHGRAHKGHALKRIAEERHAAGDRLAAAFYAREALGARPTLKWLGFTLYLLARAALSRP